MTSLKFAMDYERRVNNMGLLEILLIILVISWLGGFALHIGGGLIHILLIIALIVFIYRMINRQGV